jgi:hypothetical protein
MTLTDLFFFIVVHGVLRRAIQNKPHQVEQGSRRVCPSESSPSSSFYHSLKSRGDSLVAPAGSLVLVFQNLAPDGTTFASGA